MDHCAGYAFGTGLFAWSRVIWDTSKMLLGLAAVHNMFEWMLISHLYLKEAFLLRASNLPTNGPTVKKGEQLSYGWIWFVITVTISLPILYAIALEQSTGIVCAYILLITFILFSRTRSTSGHLRELWKIGLVASIFHFGQIWTLVIAAFGLSGFWGRINEWVLIFSAGITFALYSQFALKWEEVYYETNPGAADHHENPLDSPARTTNGVKSCLIVTFFSLLLWFPQSLAPAPSSESVRAVT